MGNWLSMSEAQILSPVLRGIYNWSTVFLKVLVSYQHEQGGSF